MINAVPWESDPSKTVDIWRMQLALLKQDFSALLDSSLLLWKGSLLNHVWNVGKNLHTIFFFTSAVQMIVLISIFFRIKHQLFSCVTLEHQINVFRFFPSYLYSIMRETFLSFSYSYKISMNTFIELFSTYFIGEVVFWHTTFHGGMTLWLR